jgi:hypothetical protein
MYYDPKRSYHNFLNEPKFTAKFMYLFFTSESVIRFTCPYHGWTYGLDGRLTRANRLRDIKDFKTRNFGLKPMAVAEWGPLVFVNVNPDADKENKIAK